MAPHWGAQRIGHDGHLGIGDLTVATLAPQLQGCLCEEGQAVHAAFAQMAAVGVERQ
jgi:hypothetical protein